MGSATGSVYQRTAFVADRLVYISERNELGITTGTICPVDDRIPIDEYWADHPEILWICDNCDQPYPVTAEFKVREGEWITLCAACLQRAINGINYSLANPKSGSP